MGINGKAFLSLLVLTTLAFAALTVWLWPRFSGRGAKPLAWRIGMLLGTQLSLAATFLLTVNAAGGFYTSWGQLSGTASSKFTITDRGRPDPAADAAQLQLGTDAAGILHGLRSTLTARVHVFTPTGYTAPTASKLQFPVEIADLTGAHVTPPAPDYQQVANTYQLIVTVVEDAGESRVSGGTGSALIPGVNVPDGPQGELFWAQDLRTALAAHYRVASDPAYWGIAGIDQSGGAAIDLAVQDSAHYGLAAAAGDWTAGPAQDSWPGIDTYLAGASLPSARLLYDPSANGIPTKISATVGPLHVTKQSSLSLSGALDWLGASIDAGWSGIGRARGHGHGGASA